MKKIILALSLCVLPLVAEDAVKSVEAVKPHSKKAMTLEERKEALNARLVKLLEEHKGDWSKVWADMNKKNELGKVGDKRTNYVVCYSKEGDKFTGLVHPKKKFRGDVTGADFAKLLPSMFEAAGKGKHPYEYNAHKKEALVIDMNAVDSKVAAGTQICAVTEAEKVETNAPKLVKAESEKAPHMEDVKPTSMVEASASEMKGAMKTAAQMTEDQKAKVEKANDIKSKDVQDLDQPQEQKA